jgi:polyribonucleotide nucleotidyltransferase
VWTNFAGKLEAAIVPDKQARDEAFGALKEEAKAHLAETLGEDALAERSQEFSAAWKSLQKKVMRRRVIEQGVRLDGRGATDIRPLSAEVGVLPRAHGSALFSRARRSAQRDDARHAPHDPDDRHARSRGHQALHPPLQLPAVLHRGDRPRGFAASPGDRARCARRARVDPVVPHEEEFPYALRLVSDVMSSKGSTSMASVCGSTLSMMDAGVPLKAPVAGIAMGMIADDGKFVTLTDILGAEDALATWTSRSPARRSSSPRSSST